MPSQDRFLDMARAFKPRSSGQLYEMVREMIGEPDAQRVCEFFKMKKDMTPIEELACLAQKVDYRPKKRWFDWLRTVCCRNREKMALQMMHAALIMIGRWYLEERDRPLAPLTRPATGATAAAPPQAIYVGYVALALMIPPSAIGDLPPIGQPLQLERVLDLIGKTEFWRCSPRDNADDQEKELNLSGVPGSPCSEGRGYIYVRVDIENGGDLLTAGSLSVLKSYLRDKQYSAKLANRAVYGGNAEALHHFRGI